MSKGIGIVVVCEDQEQQSLLLRYMETCRINTSRDVRLTYVPARIEGGKSKDAGTKRVKEMFVKELQACRARQAKAKTLLITMIDADREKWNYDTRKSELEATLGDDAPLKIDDPYVLFVPKRHVETWIRAALGSSVNEIDDYKKPMPTKEEIKKAANNIYLWAHDNSTLNPSLIPSLKNSLPDWKKVG